MHPSHDPRDRSKTLSRCKRSLANVTAEEIQGVVIRGTHLPLVPQYYRFSAPERRLLSSRAVAFDSRRENHFALPILPHETNHWPRSIEQTG